MGKIKGWTKSSPYYGWGFKGQNNGFVYISEKSQDKKDKYSVYIYKSYFSGMSERPDIRRYFKTKALAMAYATRYMKSHSKG